MIFYGGFLPTFKEAMTTCPPEILSRKPVSFPTSVDRLGLFTDQLQQTSELRLLNNTVNPLIATIICCYLQYTQ